MYWEGKIETRTGFAASSGIVAAFRNWCALKRPSASVCDDITQTSVCMPVGIGVFARAGAPQCPQAMATPRQKWPVSSGTRNGGVTKV